MKKILTSMSLLFLAMCFVGGMQAYTIQTYSVFYDWRTAILNPGGRIVNENFDDQILEPGFSITEFGGAGKLDEANSGVYENIVDKDPLRYQIYNYSPGMYAFGGFFNTAIPGGSGNSINVVINDNNQFVLNIPNTATDDFFGFIVTSGGSFTGVKFEAGDEPGTQETYYDIDISLAPVPEPSSLLLLGLGMISAGYFIRRNRG